MHDKNIVILLFFLVKVTTGFSQSDGEHFGIYDDYVNSFLSGQTSCEFDFSFTFESDPDYENLAYLNGKQVFYASRDSHCNFVVIKKLDFTSFVPVLEEEENVYSLDGEKLIKQTKRWKNITLTEFDSNFINTFEFVDDSWNYEISVFSYEKDSIYPSCKKVSSGQEESNMKPSMEVHYKYNESGYLREEIVWRIRNGVKSISQRNKYIRNESGQLLRKDEISAFGNKCQFYYDDGYLVKTVIGDREVLHEKNVKELPVMVDGKFMIKDNSVYYLVPSK